MKKIAMTCAALVAAAASTSGCAATTVEPGHRGLYFEPTGGGLRREVLSGHVDNFSTVVENVHMVYGFRTSFTVAMPLPPGKDQGN